MKVTKMTLITALAAGSLLALSPALRADDGSNSPPAGGPPPGMRDRGPNFGRIAEQLNLTDDQKPKVQAILDDQREQMRGVWQDQDLSREDRMAKMKTIHDGTDAKMKAVLAADQFEKWQKMESRMRGRRNGPPGGPPPEGGNTNAPPAAPPQA